MKLIRFLLVGLLTVGILVVTPQLALANGTTPPADGSTSLHVTKTATGFWERTHRWTIDKSVTPEVLDILEGGSASAEYMVRVVRDAGVDRFYVTGQICVTNTGAAATQGLTIVDALEYKLDPNGAATVLAQQTITPGELGPGESACYPYNMDFTPVSGAIYKNIASVYINNLTGFVGAAKETVARAEFFIPANPTLINGTIHVDDTNGSSWEFSDSGSVSYPRVFTCVDKGTNVNTATIRETGASDSATVVVNCIPVSDGCSLTIGYWKTHAGFGPQPDRVTPLLPQYLGTFGGSKTVTVGDAATAVNVLSMNLGSPSNGITKLYAQLLGAKLSIANGASSSAVATTIAQADAFLATYDHTHWDSLSRTMKNQVNAWMSTLDSYNNGLIGPGHCD